MTLHSHNDFSIPEETVRVSRAAYPKGNPYLQLRDALGTIYQDQAFAHLFPDTGRPAQARLSAGFTYCAAVPGRIARSTSGRCSYGGAFVHEELKLELSETKTLITHARSEAAKFLGYELTILQKDTRRTKNKVYGTKRRSINGGWGLVFHEPSSETLERQVASKGCMLGSEEGGRKSTGNGNSSASYPTRCI